MDKGGLCRLQKMGNPFVINVGSSDTLVGSAKVAQCGGMDSIQVAVSEMLVTQMCLGAETRDTRLVHYRESGCGVIANRLALSQASVMDIGTVGKCP